jgi:hypothetical protein
MTDWFDADLGGFEVNVDCQTCGSVGCGRGVVAA